MTFQSNNKCIICYYFRIEENALNILNLIVFQTRATVKFDVKESVNVSTVAAARKIPDDVTFPEKPQDIAKVIRPEQECMSVLEVTTEEVTTMLPTKDVEDVAEVVTSPQETVTITEVGTEISLGEFAQEDYNKVKTKKKVTIQESVQVQEFVRDEETSDKVYCEQSDLSITEVR